MIIEAKQLSDISGDFEFYYDQKYTYRGQYDKFFSIKDILMLKDGNVSIWARHKFVNPINYIPFLHLLGVTRQKHKFIVYNDLTPIAQITYKRKFYKTRYKIELSDSDCLYIYAYYKKGFHYLCVYKNVYKQEKQIALIERGVALTYTYKLYLPDEFSDFANVLSIFMLYYENSMSSINLHLSFGLNGLSIHSGSDFTLGLYEVFCNNNAAKKYDPTWRERNFPNENFFGPINTAGDQSDV